MFRTVRVGRFLFSRSSSVSPSNIHTYIHKFHLPAHRGALIAIGSLLI